MTTRGTNPSISPPVQIPQPRHVSTISSGTPPPNQQLYPGQSPGLVQGPAFNYIPQHYPQGDPLLSYQAYGSAPNDLRGSSVSSGRGGAGPTNMAQSGAFYHQTNQNMRPSQPPPPSHTPQYYIGHQPGQMRHTRPTHTSNQAMFLIPQNNNMVISASMYPQPAGRMPPFSQSGPQYPARYPGQGLVYFNGVPRASMPMQAQGMGPPPQPREKRYISISDPNTGRNITDELIKSQHHQVADDKADPDDASMNDKGVEIRKDFTRQVVERMKTESASAQSQSSAEPVNPSQSQPSQDHPQIPSYPSGPHQQPQQQSTPPLTGAPAPGTMMRPMRMASPAINLSVPPPQLPPNMVYGNPRHNKNQQSLPGQVQTNMPVQTQALPPKGPPPPSTAAVMDSAPMTRSTEASMPAAQEAPPTIDRKPIPAHAEPVIPQGDIPAPKPSVAAVQAPVQQEISSKNSATSQNAPLPSQNQKPKISNPAQDYSVPSAAAPTHTAPAPSVEQMPAPTVSNAPTPAPAPAPAPTSAPTSAPSSAPQPTVTTVTSVPPKPSVETCQPATETLKQATEEVAKQPHPEEAEKQPEISTSGKEEVTQGASTQNSKDGRKGKKNKKEFNRKESGGSDMDAFIGKDSGVDSETGPTVQEQKSPSENLPQEKADEVSQPTVNSVSKSAEEQAANVKKEPSPESLIVVAIEQPDKQSLTVEEVKPDEIIAEQEQEKETMKPEKNNQNGLKEETKVEKPASVPIDTPVVNSVPEEIPVESNDQQSKMTDLPPEENGMAKIEEVEVSKAEEFAKLKKSGGKLVYDRAYLMELRECASSQTKPDGLPELDIILDKPNPALSRTSGGPADFTPSFFQTGTNPRHAPPIGKSSSRGRQRPDMPVTPRIIKSISMSSDTKVLHQAENPWKPTKKEDKDERQILEGEILFIMNRLTPTNFEKLALDMKKLNVKTYEDLIFMVKTFFDKVTIETKFVEAYAKLCKVMSGLKVPPPEDGTVKEHMATFRVVMLTKCQKEFEADKSIIFEDPEERKKKLEMENPEKTPERDQKIENVLYQMKLRRMKFYGNIRFIGELFKLGMLTESIMHDCIYRLLKARDDDSLVSLCNLLTTVGRNLDTEKAKPRMDQYFSQMSKIADERKSRIKFTLRDVIELRLNNWVPRKETTGPKKIEDVHKDFAQEQARNQYLASQPLPPRNDSSQAGSRRGSRQRQDDKPNEDGWNTVSSKAVRMIDVSKMKISKNVVDDNIQLGPGGGVHRQTLWSRGSHGGAQPSQDDRPTIGSNRFSALTSDDARRPFPRSPSRGENSAGRSLRQGPTAGHGRGKIMTRSSQEGERREAIASARSFMGGRSQNSSRDNSWNRDDRRQFMGPRNSGDNPMTRSDSGVRIEEFRAPAPPAIKQMTESEIDTKAVNILDEYLNIRDLPEAKLCVKELSGQNSLYRIVTSSVNNVIEKKDEARHMTGNLFHELVTNNLLTISMYIRGLNEFLQDASDLVMDIPTLWNCIAQVICPLLLGGSLPWSKLGQALTPHLDNKDGAKLLSCILSQCVEKQGEKEVAHHWQNSGLNWSTYLKGDEINVFVKDKKLDFTLGAASSTGSGSDKMFDVERLIQSKAPSSEVIAYIEKSISEKTDNSFIRALTNAVVRASINEKKNLTEDVIKTYKGVLQRYIGGSIELQLQALYAIQVLMAKLEHPSGVLSRLFELLYDEVMIEEEAFNRWEKSTDPNEQESKGTCLMQVRQFFTWLRENEDPES